jgi:hypothetical protein
MPLQLNKRAAFQIDGSCLYPDRPWRLPGVFRQSGATPRRVRVQYPGAMYPVMNRGNRRQDIFLDGVDRQDFPGFLVAAAIDAYLKFLKPVPGLTRGRPRCASLPSGGIICSHPHAELTAVTSRQYAGQTLAHTRVVVRSCHMDIWGDPVFWRCQNPTAKPPLLVRLDCRCPTLALILRQETVKPPRLNLRAPQSVACRCWSPAPARRASSCDAYGDLVTQTAA